MGLTIIAEIGINHNGNLNLAHELIRQAKANGADLAKFQFYDPAKIFGPKGSHPDAKNFAWAKTVELDFESARKLKRWCDEEEIEFSASSFDEERFKWMEELGVRRHKIASRTVDADPALCKRILATGKETFVSLGLWKGKGVPFKAANARYLYCITKYPVELPDVKLPRDFGRSDYAGFSDHTLGIEAALTAIGRGATVIEKHFTLSKGMAGPDHVLSMDPPELNTLARLGRQMAKVA